jgi:hypothetical protein
MSTLYFQRPRLIFFLSLAFFQGSLTYQDHLRLAVEDPNVENSITRPPNDHQSLRVRADLQPPALCGFVDYKFSWACGPRSTCFYNTDISGVGCCIAGSSTPSCDYATSCVPSASLGASPTPIPNLLYWYVMYFVIPTLDRILPGRRADTNLQQRQSKPLLCNRNV